MVAFIAEMMKCRHIAAAWQGSGNFITGTYIQRLNSQRPENLLYEVHPFKCFSAFCNRRRGFYSPTSCMVFVITFSLTSRKVAGAVFPVSTFC
jgi:hypothetical protein